MKSRTSTLVMPDEAQGQICQEGVAEEEQDVVTDVGALVHMVEAKVLENSEAICMSERIQGMNNERQMSD